MAKRSGQSGTVEPKGNKWHFRYLHDTPNGRVRKSIPIGAVNEMTKTQAKRLGREWLRKNGINIRENMERAIDPPTFDTALEKWREACLPTYKPSGRDTTRYQVKKHVEPRFTGKPLEQVNKQAVQVWINDLKGTMAPKTVRNLVKILKSVLNWNDIGTRDWKLRLPALPDDEQRWFTKAEAALIINAATGQYKVLYRLAYYTGMRCGELFALKPGDFDFTDNTVTVAKSVYKQVDGTPKSGKKRRVHLDDVTASMVKELLGDRTTGRVFMTKDGTAMNSGDVNRYNLKPLCRKLGIPVGTMQAFRHGRVTAMSSGGVGEKVRLLEVGHSTLRMNLKYDHADEEMLRQAAQRLAS
jgi:integrase